VLIQNETLASCKQNEILSFAVMWVEFKDIMLSDTSHAQKDKYHMLSLICEAKKKINITEESE
jgi:hypothetical protein